MVDGSENNWDEWSHTHNWVGVGIGIGIGIGNGLSRIASLMTKITGIDYGTHNWDGSKLHFPVPVPTFRILVPTL